MYAIGLLFYIGIVTLYIFFDSIRNLVYQAMKLAPEITIIIGFIIIYPLVIFLIHLIGRKREASHGRYLSSQAKLAASVAVSFGLIGTFQGLTEMVSTISQSMGGGDHNADLVERMNTMINSISSALASMSYAFITSICGVAGSVLVLLALNFFMSYYKKEDKQAAGEIQTGKDYTKEINLLLARLNTVEELNLGVAKKLVGLSAVEEESAKVINLLSEVKTNLSSTLNDVSVLNQNQLEIQKATVNALHEFNRIMQEYEEKNQQRAAENLLQLNNIMGEQKQALGVIGESIDKVNDTLEKTFIYTQQLPELINQQTQLNEILHGVKSDMVNGMQLLSNDVRLIPDLLHTQNISTNILIEAQHGLSSGIQQTTAGLQELVEEQRKSRLSSGKIRKGLQQALEIMSDE